MATFPDPTHSTDGAEPVRPVLRIEMQAAERGVLTLFAASFIEWIRDARGSRFARAAGAPASVSFDETPPDAETATLRVTVTWPLPPGAEAGPVVRTLTAGAADGPNADLDAVVEPSTSLFCESQTPIPTSPLAAVDLTSMVAEVFARSQTLTGHSPREEGTPARRFGPLLIAAARARESVQHWTAEAAWHGRDLTERGRRRAHVAAASWRSSSRTRLDGMRVAVRLPKVSRTGVRRTSWATAGLCLAAVMYVAWPARILTSPTVAPPHAAAIPSAPLATSGTMTEASLNGGADGLLADVPAPLKAPAVKSGTRTPVVAVAQSRPKAAPAVRAPLPPGYFGSLVITSEPGGADVSVDGLPRGRTPLSITRLNVGSRVVRVDMPGHQPWAWAVSVVANKKTAVVVKLLPAVASSDASGAEPDRRSTDPRR